MILSSPEVLIITSAYNRPDFIELQYKTFQKFLKESFSFVVFNDAPTDALRTQITNSCKNIGIKSITVPSSIHTKNFPKRYLGEPLTLETRGIQSMQYALQEVGLHHDGIVMFVDSDIFLVKTFSVTEFLDKCHIAGLPLEKDTVRYMWSGLVLIDMLSAPQKNTLSFYPIRVEHTVLDAGGSTHYYLQNSQVRFKPIDNVLSTSMNICKKVSCKTNDMCCVHDRQLFETVGFDKNQIEFLSQCPRNIEFLCNNKFLHYRGGSNWDAKSVSYISKKTALVNAYIETLLVD